MKRIYLDQKELKSYIECEEYFPLRVVYDKSSGNTDFVGYYYSDSGLLEFDVNRENNHIKQMQIVNCDKYGFVDADGPCPDDFEEGALCIPLPSHNDCDIFYVTVYRDSMEISISTEPAVKYFKSGQVIFGISSKEHLVSVLVTNMTAAEVKHAKNELDIASSYNTTE